jgi:broad-specificity NMP kinase
MNELIILRGLPGSGKSTLAKSLAGGSGSDYFEADQYFVDDEGNYNFDASKLRQAHQWCKDQVEFAMTKGHKNFLPIHGPHPLVRIIVSNTFTQEWEMEPYYEMAKKHGYKVYSLIVENRHSGINEHGVPDEKVEQMESRFQIKLK